MQNTAFNSKNTAKKRKKEDCRSSPLFLCSVALGTQGQAQFEFEITQNLFAKLVNFLNR